MAKRSKAAAKKARASRASQSGGVNIGGDAQVHARDIIGRDKITQIVIQFWPALIGVVLIALVALIVYWFRYVPDKMSGGFKVAVAQFGRVDANGNVQSSDDGDKLSKFIYDQLNSEFNALTQDPAIKEDFSPQLWHDSMEPFQKRATIGMIPNKSPDKEKSLQELAKRINADLIIYGNLEANQSAATFEPQFYIPQSIKAEADEITGNTQLGTPVTIPLPVDLDSAGARRSLTRNLSVRTSALAQFTIGVLYDTFGDNDRAYNVFTEAEKKLTDWDESQGKEILYYFIGREAWSLANGHKNLTRVFKSADEALQKAKEALDHAKQINPRYARTHIGWGNVYFLRAQTVLVAERVQATEFATALQDVDAAVGEYQYVLTSTVPSTEPQTYLKAQLSLGNAYRLKGHAYLLRAEFDTAAPLFDSAIKAMEQALPTIDASQFRLLVQTYLNLGVAYQEQAHTQNVQHQNERGRPLYEKARDYYLKCGEQAKSGPALNDAYVQDVAAKFCAPYAKAMDDVLKELKGGN